MSQSVLSRVSLVGRASASVLSRVRLVAGDPRGSVLSKVRLVASSSTISVEAGLPATFDPFELVDLAANVTGSPDTVTWSVDSVSNPVAIAAPVLLTGAGAARQYWAPPAVNGQVIVWRVTATKAGEPSVSDTVTHTIRNHQGLWLFTGPDYNNGPGRQAILTSYFVPPDIDPETP